MIRVSHVITNLGNGGAEAVLYRLCKTTPNVSHSVVSLMGEGKYGPLLRDMGIPVICLNMSRSRVSLSGLVRLRRFLRREQPDVAQTWMYHANLLGSLASWMAGHRTVVWGIRHSELEPGKSRGTTRIVAHICAWLSRIMPCRIIVCAHRAAEVHADMRYDIRRMTVIENGYDLVDFRPDNSARAAVRRESDIAPTERVLGFVARFSPEKDHECLLAALAELQAQRHTVRTLLVGPGMVRGNPDLTELIRRYRLEEQVLLMGPRGDIPAIMAALDLHVMSSSAEGFPNVLAEAMACGTPCVTTDVGDAAGIVGETGWVVPPGSPASLAEAIRAALEAMEDSSGWREREKAARRRIQDEYSVSRMAQAYESVWHECI